MTTKLRAALYVRLSEDTDESTSPQRQRDITAAYANAREWTAVGTYEDIDVSATHARLDRPGLSRLRADVAAGRVDVVIVWRLDRLARKVIDLLTLLEEFTKASASVASATEGIDLTTAGGRAMATLIGVFAEMEADAIRERVTASVAALRKGGRFSGGAVPYGYRPIPNTDGPGMVLVPEPEEVERLNAAAVRVLAGDALWRVCRDLNTDAVPSARSAARREVRYGRSAEGADTGSWTTTSLRKMLTSEVLLGRQMHRGDVIRDEAGLPVAMWAPLLDRALVEQLRGLLRPTTPTPPRRKRARLLSGLLRCGLCGKAMYVATSRGASCYRCMDKSSGGTCKSPTVSAPMAEEYVEQTVLDAIGARPVMETVSEAAPESEAARAALHDVATALASVGTALTDDAADVAALLNRRALLLAERARLRQITATPSVLSFIRDTGRTFAQDWHAADLTGRQRMLADKVVRVELTRSTPSARKFDPSRVEIVWVIDDPMDGVMPVRGAVRRP